MACAFLLYCPHSIPGFCRRRRPHAQDERFRGHGVQCTPKFDPAHPASDPPNYTAAFSGFDQREISEGIKPDQMNWMFFRATYTLNKEVRESAHNRQ